MLNTGFTGELVTVVGSWMLNVTHSRKEMPTTKPLTMVAIRDRGPDTSAACVSSAWKPGTGTAGTDKEGVRRTNGCTRKEDATAWVMMTANRDDDGSIP
jgi:hypothetical protein